MVLKWLAGTAALAASNVVVFPDAQPPSSSVAPLAYCHGAPLRRTTPAPSPTWANHGARSDVSTTSNWLCARSTPPVWSVVPTESVTATRLGENETPATTPRRFVAQNSALTPSKIDPSGRFSSCVLGLLGDPCLINDPLGTYKPIWGAISSWADAVTGARRPAATAN